MITLPRAVCRELAQVFRSLSQTLCPDRPVEFEAGRSGLSIRAATSDTTVIRHWPARRPDKTLVIPIRVLDECGGPGDTPVVFRAASGGGTVEWTDRGRPVRRTCPAPVPGPPTINRPARFTPATSGLLTALGGCPASRGEIGTCAQPSAAPRPR